VYYLKPTSRSRALNTPVTSYSSHPIILSATILLGCGFCRLALCQCFREAVAYITAAQNDVQKQRGSTELKVSIETLTELNPILK
jgi:hypothetical protein